MNTLKAVLSEIPAYSHFNKSLYDVLLTHELRHDRNILLGLATYHLTLDLGSRDQAWWDIFPGLKEETHVIDLGEIQLAFVYRPDHDEWILEVRDHRGNVHYEYSLTVFPPFKEMLNFYL